MHPDSCDSFARVMRQKRMRGKKRMPASEHDTRTGRFGCTDARHDHHLRLISSSSPSAAVSVVAFDFQTTFAFPVPVRLTDTPEAEDEERIAFPFLTISFAVVLSFNSG